MQYFYINKDSQLPFLRVEMVYDGREEYFKAFHFYNAIQNADVRFKMWDEDGNLKINSQCDIVLTDINTCDEHYIIEYKWKKRDTSKKGKYKGQFIITFKGDLYNESDEYYDADLIMPIYEDLTVMIK